MLELILVTVNHHLGMGNRLVGAKRLRQYKEERALI